MFIILKLIKIKINRKIESQIVENNKKIKNKFMKGLLDIILNILVKIKILKYKISKKKSASIKEDEKAIPNQLLNSVKQ